MTEARRLVVVAALAGVVGGGATLAFFGPHRPTGAQDRGSGVPAAKDARGDDPSQRFRQVAKLVSPSVVHITREREHAVDPESLEEQFRRLFGSRSPQREQAFGSGVIVRADGVILTNNHVAGGGGKLTVRLADGRELPGRLVGADPRTDVAVCRVEATGLPVVALADSDTLEVGDWVLAFGNPFGLEHSVTAGIVSAKSRSKVGVADYEDFIQTDAAINPGNSGGALVDTHGRLVGINTAIASRTGGNQGIGFAIPIVMAKQIMEALLRDGYVVRGFLGIQTQDASAELSDRLGLGARAGALVTQVVPGSPAAKAGLKELDLVLALDQKPVDGSNRLRLGAASLPVGKKVDVKVLREGQELVLSATIAERPGDEAARPPAEPEKPAAAPSSVGITAQPVTPVLARRMNLARAEGAVVTEVAPGSLAAEAGIQRGVVILEIDRKKIGGLEDLEKAIQGMEPKKGIVLKLTDGRSASYVLLKAR